MVPIALASDTLSIATMEVVDNLVILVIPGALDAGLGDILFWGSLAFSLVVAGAAAIPVNRWLIARGKGHVAVHETGIHGGPPVRVGRDRRRRRRGLRNRGAPRGSARLSYSYWSALRTSRREARRAGAIAAITPATAAKTRSAIRVETG